MTVVALDDTDSRTHGMCTTYAATLVAERIESAGAHVERVLLVRLNPAVDRKTRGNAALAIHTDLDADRAFDLALGCLETYAVDDERTSPGVVVADMDPGAVPSEVAAFGEAAIRELHDRSDALALIDRHGFRHAAVQSDSSGPSDDGSAGYGRIGALAAVGAWRAIEEWTYEHIAYRAFDRCGTPRTVDEESVFAAADSEYPTVWDTVDRDEGEAVCVPNAPGPILYGIRGDDPDACRRVADRIESEPIERSRTFVTNQGTDAHIAHGEIGTLRDNAGYQAEGVVVAPPATRRGGHTFVELASSEAVDVGTSAVTNELLPADEPLSLQPDAATVTCAAFEPTKRFRAVVRSLRPGDSITAVGEHEAGTIKLEKLRVRGLIEEEPATPTCPDCGRSMSSAGRNQGYRCRDCSTSHPSKVSKAIDRELELGWYEVPPCARRHLAKPLVRGGFKPPVHPER